MSPALKSAVCHCQRGKKGANRSVRHNTLAHTNPERKPAYQPYLVGRLIGVCTKLDNTRFNGNPLHPTSSCPQTLYVPLHSRRGLYAWMLV